MSKYFIYSCSVMYQYENYVKTFSVYTSLKQTLMLLSHSYISGKMIITISAHVWWKHSNHSSAHMAEEL